MLLSITRQSLVTSNASRSIFNGVAWYLRTFKIPSTGVATAQVSPCFDGYNARSPDLDTRRYRYDWYTLSSHMLFHFDEIIIGLNLLAEESLSEGSLNLCAIERHPTTVCTQPYPGAGTCGNAGARGNYTNGQSAPYWKDCRKWTEIAKTSLFSP